MTAVVLGLDLALERTGWAVITEEHGHVVGAGEIVTRAADLLAIRLHDIADAVRRLVMTWEPYAVAMESVAVVGPQRSTPLTIAKVHGAVLADFGRRGDYPQDFAPATIKKHATGNGRASKDDVVAAAVERWPMESLPGPYVRLTRWTDNEADALWCADLGRLAIAREIEEAGA